MNSYTIMEIRQLLAFIVHVCIPFSNFLFHLFIRIEFSLVVFLLIL
jgi:hypothetical protein